MLHAPGFPARNFHLAMPAHPRFRRNGGAGCAVAHTGRARSMPRSQNCTNMFIKNTGIRRKISGIIPDIIRDVPNVVSVFQTYTFIYISCAPFEGYHVFLLLSDRPFATLGEVMAHYQASHPAVAGGQCYWMFTTKHSWPKKDENNGE